MIRHVIGRVIYLFFILDAVGPGMVPDDGVHQL